MPASQVRPDWNTLRQGTGPATEIATYRFSADGTVEDQIMRSPTASPTTLSSNDLLTMVDTASATAKMAATADSTAFMSNGNAWQNKLTYASTLQDVEVSLGMHWQKQNVARDMR